jgi:hypothetical protein
MWAATCLAERQSLKESGQINTFIPFIFVISKIAIADHIGHKDFVFNEATD